MTVHLQREIEKLKKMLLSVGALVEKNVLTAIISINNFSDEILAEAKEVDDKIDNLEVEVEEECLKILALHQPVAIDLRFIVAVLKINNDLERVSDLAVNIIKQRGYQELKEGSKIDFDFESMAEKVRLMLKNSLDALVNLDAALAHDVIEADDEVDDIHKEMYKFLDREIKTSHEAAANMVNQMQISRSLERIADLATNIAEDVIYMIDGKIVRHVSD